MVWSAQCSGSSSILRSPTARAASVTPCRSQKSCQYSLISSADIGIIGSPAAHSTEGQPLSMTTVSAFTPDTRGAIPVTPVAKKDLAAWLKRATARERAWLTGSGFDARPGAFAFVPGRDGRPARVLVGTNPDTHRMWALAGLPHALPEGRYRLDEQPGRDIATQMALGWALGAYRFTRYKRAQRGVAKLAWPVDADRREVEILAAAVTLARDLINTPAEDLGPSDLAAAAQAVAQAATARRSPSSRGDGLLQARLPHDPRRGPRFGRCAALHRHALGQTRRSQGHAGRQGRMLRFGRPRHQALFRDADDEEGHGRRRGGPVGREPDHGNETPRVAPRPRARRGEQHQRQRLPAPRCHSHPQGHHRGDRQHGRGGALGSLRSAHGGLLREARCDCRFRDAHRGGPCGPRHGLARTLRQRRHARGRHPRRGEARARSALAHAAPPRLPEVLGQHRGGHQQRRAKQLRRRDHGGVVLGRVRRQGRRHGLTSTCSRRTPLPAPAAPRAAKPRDCARCTARSASATPDRSNAMTTGNDTHSKTIGYVLWIFGFTGSHRFYYGRPVTGTIWFFTLGLFLIGWIVDLFLIPSMDRQAD